MCTWLYLTKWGRHINCLFPMHMLYKLRPTTPFGFENIKYRGKMWYEKAVFHAIWMYTWEVDNYKFILYKNDNFLYLHAFVVTLCLGLNKNTGTRLITSLVTCQNYMYDEKEIIIVIIIIYLCILLTFIMRVDMTERCFWFTFWQFDFLERI